MQNTTDMTATRAITPRQTTAPSKEHQVSVVFENADDLKHFLIEGIASGSFDFADAARIKEHHYRKLASGQGASIDLTFSNGRLILFG